MKKIGILLAVVIFLAALSFLGIRYYEASQFKQTFQTPTETVVIPPTPVVTVGPKPSMLDEDGSVFSHLDNSIYNLDNK